MGYQVQILVSLILQQIMANFTTNLSNFCQSTKIHDILWSVVKTASLALLRSTHSVSIVDFTTEIFAVIWTWIDIWKNLLSLSLVYVYFEWPLVSCLWFSKQMHLIYWYLAPFGLKTDNTKIWKQNIMLCWLWLCQTKSAWKNSRPNTSFVVYSVFNF